MSRADVWGVRPAEQLSPYPCDVIAPTHSRRRLRGVDIDAPTDVVYRWLCQLRAAPYSYDLVDNKGHRSPRVPLPWCWDLEIGQSVCNVFTLESFQFNEHLTIKTSPRGAELFGDVATTYQVAARGRQHSRLLAVVCYPTPTTSLQRLKSWLLGWGNLVMMRKQLRTLGRLAAAEHAASGEASSATA